MVEQLASIACARLRHIERVIAICRRRDVRYETESLYFALLCMSYFVISVGLRAEVESAMRGLRDCEDLLTRKLKVCCGSIELSSVDLEFFLL